jgi:hypothetical protein
MSKVTAIGPGPTSRIDGSTWYAFGPIRAADRIGAHGYDAERRRSGRRRAALFRCSVARFLRAGEAA